MQRGAPVIIVTVIVVGLLTAYLFQLWVRHQRRLMIHRERLAAIEKGVEPPALEQELRRGSSNVQRLLLLAGLCWISVGLALFMAIHALSGESPLHLPWGVDSHGVQWFEVRVRPGMRPLALAPIGIGVSHIVVYFLGQRREGP
jgi:hypothetical protein